MMLPYFDIRKLRERTNIVDKGEPEPVIFSSISTEQSPVVRGPSYLYNLSVYFEFQKEFIDEDDEIVMEQTYTRSANSILGGELAVSPKKLILWNRYIQGSFTTYSSKSYDERLKHLVSIDDYRKSPHKNPVHPLRASHKGNPFDWVFDALIKFVSGTGNTVDPKIVQDWVVRASDKEFYEWDTEFGLNEEGDHAMTFFSLEAPIRLPYKWKKSKTFVWN